MFRVPVTSSPGKSAPRNRLESFSLQMCSFTKCSCQVCFALVCFVLCLLCFVYYALRAAPHLLLAREREEVGCQTRHSLIGTTQIKNLATHTENENKLKLQSNLETVSGGDSAPHYLFLSVVNASMANLLLPGHKGIKTAAVPTQYHHFLRYRKTMPWTNRWMQEKLWRKPKLVPLAFQADLAGKRRFAGPPPSLRCF